MISSIRPPSCITKHLCLREMGNPNRVIQFAQDCIKQNIQSNHYRKNQYIARYTNLDFFKLGNGRILTLKRNQINCWNIFKKTIVWSVTSENPFISWGNFVIADENKAVFWGLKVDYIFTPIIKIFSIIDGACQATILDPRLNLDCVPVIKDNQIFTVLSKEKQIIEWNLEGQFVKSISSGLSNKFNSLFFFNNKLIAHDPEVLAIFYRERKLEIKLCSNTHFSISNPLISAIYFDNQQIICGLDRGTGYNDDDQRKTYYSVLQRLKWDPKQTQLICCSVDINSGEILNVYPQKVCKSDTKQDKANGELEDGYPIALGVRNGIIYLGDSSGLVLSINLTEQYHTKLGSHDEAVHCLSIDKDVMITMSLNKIKIWDLEKHFLLKSIDISSCQEIHYKDGQLFAACKNGLLFQNYCISPSHELPLVESFLAED